MTSQRNYLLPALAFAVLLASAAAVSPYDEPHGMQRDENGKNFIISPEGEKYLVYRDEESNKIFYQHAVTGEPQWDDPREQKPIVEPALPPAKAGPTSSLTVAAVAVIPMILLIAGVSARIYYLHTYYPELLFPTKERKERRRSGGKFKPQKARGKMSQDGKGGRSANS